MPWQSVPLEESLPTCQKGDTFAVGEVKMLEKQTSPPDYLTEAELITLMEKHGIGGYPDLGFPFPGPWAKKGILALGKHAHDPCAPGQRVVTGGPVYDPWLQLTHCVQLFARPSI